MIPFSTPRCLTVRAISDSVRSTLALRVRLAGVLHHQLLSGSVSVRPTSTRSIPHAFQPSHTWHEAPALEAKLSEQPNTCVVGREHGRCEGFDAERRCVLYGLCEQVCAQALDAVLSDAERSMVRGVAKERLTASLNCRWLEYSCTFE